MIETVFLILLFAFPGSLIVGLLLAVRSRSRMVQDDLDVREAGLVPVYARSWTFWRCCLRSLSSEAIWSEAWALTRSGALHKAKQKLIRKVSDEQATQPRPSKDRKPSRGRTVRKMTPLQGALWWAVYAGERGEENWIQLSHWAETEMEDGSVAQLGYDPNNGIHWPDRQGFLRIDGDMNAVIDPEQDELAPVAGYQLQPDEEEQA